MALSPDSEVKEWILCLIGILAAVFIISAMALVYIAVEGLN